MVLLTNQLLKRHAIGRQQLVDARLVDLGDSQRRDDFVAAFEEAGLRHVLTVAPHGRWITFDPTGARGAATYAVEAKDTLVLIDADTASWSSWNRYGEQFARDSSARPVRIDDGGITGPTFFEHVRRLRRPVLNSPKGQTAPVPADLVARPVIHPAPYWTWSLVSRRDEGRATVLAVIDALAGDVGPLGLDDDAWLPVGDPHREAAR
ncbi:MAG: hypothetical protein QOG79_1246 [Mycobacterium sp.]|nr:hypothetical protein [Mycobacterium sp.]